MIECICNIIYPDFEECFRFKRTLGRGAQAEVNLYEEVWARRGSCLYAAKNYEIKENNQIYHI